MTIGSITVAQLESKKLCTPRRVQVGLLVTRQELELTVDSHTDRSNSEQLATLHQAMMANVVTYLGGLPGEACFFSLIWLFLQASLHSALPVLGKAYNYKKKKGFFSPQVPLVSSSHFSFGGSQLFNSSIIQTLRHGSLSLSLVWIWKCLDFWVGWALHVSEMPPSGTIEELHQKRKKSKHL